MNWILLLVLIALAPLLPVVMLAVLLLCWRDARRQAVAPAMPIPGRPWT